MGGSIVLGESSDELPPPHAVRKMQIIKYLSFIY